MHLFETGLANIAQAVRAMLGAPDYERYLAHMRERHPGERPLSEAELLAERQAARARPGTRCC